MKGISILLTAILTPLTLWADDQAAALHVPETAALVARARALAPDTPSNDKDHPAAVFAKDYLDANRGRLALSGPLPEVIEIHSRRDRDIGDVTYHVRFARQIACHVPVEFTDLDVVINEKGGVYKFVSAGGKWIAGLPTNCEASVSAEQARRVVVGAPRPSEAPGHASLGPISDGAVSRDAELVLVPKHGIAAPAADYVLAWKFFVSMAPPFDWYVDASVGTMVRFLQKH